MGEVGLMWIYLWDKSINQGSRLIMGSHGVEYVSFVLGRVFVPVFVVFLEVKFYKGEVKYLALVIFNYYLKDICWGILLILCNGGFNIIDLGAYIWCVNIIIVYGCVMCYSLAY